MSSYLTEPKSEPRVIWALLWFNTICGAIAFALDIAGA